MPHTAQTTVFHRRRATLRRGWRPVAAVAGLAALTAGCGVSEAPGAAVAGERVATAAPAHGRAASPRPSTHDAIQRTLDDLVRRDGVPGVLATVRDKGGHVRTYTAGVGNLKTRSPVPANGRVRIASNTKTFTATVVLQLVGEGRVKLDAPIETYLPGLVRGRGIDGRRITVRQLLQQTSGLPDYDTLVATKGLLSIQHTYFEPRQLLDAALASPAHFKPGTKWEYSNTNYLLAGLLVQRVTGRPIGEEITRRVIQRVGLRDTYWPNTGVQTIEGDHPQGYFAAAPGAKPVDVTSLDPSIGWAAGQLISTTSDLSTFTRALLGGKLLKAAQLAQMKKTVAAPDFEPQPGWSYGLGLAERTLRCGVRAWGHGGDITGFETRNLATGDGRSAVIAVTALPTSLEGLKHVNAAVEHAICTS